MVLYIYIEVKKSFKCDIMAAPGYQYPPGETPTVKGLFFMLIAGLLIIVGSFVCFVISIIGYILAIIGFFKIHGDRHAYPEPHPTNMTQSLIFYILGIAIAIIGGVIALLLSNTLEFFNLFILAFSGGGFLYLASAELLPELLEQKNLKKSVIQALIFISGIILIVSLVLILPHE